MNSLEAHALLVDNGIVRSKLPLSEEEVGLKMMDV